MPFNEQGEPVCPGCGRNSHWHATHSHQEALRFMPHEWRPVRDDYTQPESPETIYRCVQCGTTLRVPVGARGETLRAYWRAAGECPGMRE
jgi:hypothetical protein